MENQEATYNRQDIRIARVPLWVPGLLCLLVLVLDLSTPRGVAGGIAYIPLIFCSLWFTRPHMAFVFAAIATVLTIIGFFIKVPSDVDTWMVLTNRLLSIGALWFVAILVYLRRKTDQALRESEERLIFSLKTTGIGAWELNLMDNTAHRSPSHDLIFGYAEPLPKWTYDMFIEHVAPEDRALVDSKFRRAMETKSDWDFECCIHRADGQKRWIWAKGRHHFDSTGVIPKMSGIIQDITQRKQAEEAKARLAAIVEFSVDAIISKNLEGVVLSWNKGAEHLFGYSAAEAVGQHINLIIPPDRLEEEQHILAELRVGNVVEHFETRRRRKNGMLVDVFLTVSPIHDATGKIMGASKILRDISERKEAEKVNEQLRHVQKMESLGQLTGGIAHDFNNLLAIVMGNLDFMAERTKETDPLREFIKPSIEAAEHGAELTKQLLAFGRKQALQPKIISMNELLHYFSALVRNTLGERIEVILAPESELWNVNVDPSQLQNVLLNLAVNARDAMPGGGKLIFETSNASLDQEYAENNADVVPGDYVVVAVSDTGEGMTQEVMEKAFEPFFTTKEVGKGSGMGLSMVYGFVKQSKGHIKLYSEPGQGTSIKIYLPRAEGIMLNIEQAKVKPVSTEKKSQFILVVEDNKNVLKLTSSMVESMGYTVLQAETGDAAMKILEARDDIELLLTDVMLPGKLNGPELAKRATALHPNLKVLFNSGYAEQAILQSGLLEEGVNLISKPFRKQQLANKIEEVLKQ